MAASRAAISSPSEAMEPSISSIAVSESEAESSRLFFLSSVASSSFSQYSFLPSSSSCSLLRLATILSIMEVTFSKPRCLPLSASAMRSSSGATPASARRRPRARPTASRAFALAASVLTPTCRKPVAGRVFLKISSDASSFKTLMVSASVASSSARVCVRSSHSFAFVSQFLLRSARKAWSAAIACCVSSRSCLAEMISTASSPTRLDFTSIAAVRARTSFLLAAMSSPCWEIAESSSAVMSASDFSMSSCSCLRMPWISPLWGM
mmetsp:Transcript_67734/g.191965  ORF Transcript_67734/g.191965 Transcript_67734/m.191965 type:complete len:266 (+) Transcript_67734:283-1080(+)